MKTFRKARETMDDVSGAAQAVVSTSEWASVALVAVAAVSLLALALAVVALNRTR
jgi:hypothetical protein